MGRPARSIEPLNEVPDRPLEPPAETATVAIRAPGHHPFVFKKMVAGVARGPRPRDGDLVRVVDRDERPIGFGLWNGRSQIALRMVAWGTEPPGAEHWGAKLADAVDLRRGVLALDEVSDAYRLVHAEGDGLSGLIVDRFADVLSVECFSLGMYQRIGPIAGVLAPLAGTAHLRVHVDERIALAEDFPGRPVASPGAPASVAIREHGIRYRVKFEGGHKTGFFCDQRDNRRDLARWCADRSVLDVCCYTGGFALNALIRGRAREVTAVDLDEKAIAVARENANLNQVRLGLVHADAFGYLRQMAANGRDYGVVVLDPPKLIPTRAEVSLGKRKYFDLNVLAMGLVEPGGLLLTCSCSGLLPAEEFLYLLKAAARKAGRSARVLAVTGASADHPVGLDALEGAYLKAAWLRMGDRREPDPGEVSDPTDADAPG
jgi:23S rRNA (cytosine1962-C5)-methyltransferase